MPPALDAVVNDLQMPAGLAALRAHPAPTLSQLLRDDHPLMSRLTSITDAHFPRPSIRLNAVVTRIHPAACPAERQRVTQICAARERPVAEPARPRQARAARARASRRVRNVQALRALDPVGPAPVQAATKAGLTPGPRPDSPPNGQETPKRGQSGKGATSIPPRGCPYHTQGPRGEKKGKTGQRVEKPENRGRVVFASVQIARVRALALPLRLCHRAGVSGYTARASPIDGTALVPRQATFARSTTLA